MGYSPENSLGGATLSGTHMYPLLGVQGLSGPRPPFTWKRNGENVRGGCIKRV